jgi:hypothetical protein
VTKTADPLTIFMNDPIGIIAVFAVLYIKSQVPEVFEIMSAKRKKQALIIEYSKDKVFRIRRAIYKNNLWKAQSGKEHTETFQSRPEDTGWLFGLPAIAVFSTETAAVPIKEMILLRHLQNEFKVYSVGELKELFITFEKIKVKIKNDLKASSESLINHPDVIEEVEAKLSDPKNVKAMRKEMESKNLSDYSQTDLYKQLADVKKTKKYAEIQDFTLTETYRDMSSSFQKLYRDYTNIKDTGLFMKAVEVVNYSDVVRYLNKHIDPRTTRTNELNEVSLERAKHVDSLAGKSGGLLGGGLDIKKIAIILAVVIIGYSVLPSFLASMGGMGTAAHAAQTGLQATSTTMAQTAAANTTQFLPGK